MASFYLAQDDRPPRRFAPALGWLRRLWWLLPLLLLLGLGGIGGWLANDWYDDTSETACAPCEAGPGIALLAATPTPVFTPPPRLSHPNLT